MKYILLVLALPFLAASTCKKAQKAVPDCIQQKIDDIKAQPKWNPPAEVNEYEYNGERVFLFSSNCCDQFNVAYDKNCTAICAPSGGFTGKGDGKCKDFMQKAKLIRLIWKDER
jgi:hypothetical protein